MQRTIAFASSLRREGGQRERERGGECADGRGGGQVRSLGDARGATLDPSGHRRRLGLRRARWREICLVVAGLCEMIFMRSKA